MDDFTFYREGDGWIESNIRLFIEGALTQHTVADLALRHGHRMATWLYNATAPPPYPYVRAVSAFSALAQLYSRSGQMPVANTLYQRNMLSSPECRFCHHGVETSHHIFTHCAFFNSARAEAQRKLKGAVEVRIADLPNATERWREALRLKAKSFFSNNRETWPLGSSTFYLGHVPKLNIVALNSEEISGRTIRKLERELHAEFHLAGIRLCGRITGQMLRIVGERRKEEERSTKTEVLVTAEEEEQGCCVA